MSYSYRLQQNIRMDSYNWWSACNQYTYNTAWKEMIDDMLFGKLKGISEDDAFEILKPILEKKYAQDEKLIEGYKEYFQKEFNEKFIPACQKMEKVLDKPLYRDDFTFFMTLPWRCPYNKSRGHIWVCIYMRDPIAIFLHELCHFQFIHYWREKTLSPVNQLSNDQFELLKESLTIILDEDFLPIIEKIDAGFEMHQEYRQKLKTFWANNKNFDDLVNYGLKILP